MKPFCIYFPQFYPTEVNNRTWGAGFTDWILVAHTNMHNLWKRRAPKGGFYDGADTKVHIHQINQMKHYELGGVALYHYWFYKTQELDAFERTISSSEHNNDFPWFLIWATESWSKRWLGDKTEIISLTESPSTTEIREHCEYLSKCFNQHTYLKIDNRPVLILFNLSHFADPEAVVSEYRVALKNLGHNPMIGQFVKNPFDSAYSRFLDINYLFEPRLFFGFNNSARTSFAKKTFDVLKTVFGKEFCQKLLVVSDKFKKKNNTFKDIEYIKYFSSDKRKLFVESFHSQTQEVVSPGWNNVPRHGNRFTALEDIAPNEFQNMLQTASNQNEKMPPLINAWNEWSEGAAIEPCEYYGTIYLDKLKSIKSCH